ncbi:MAG: efflux RND transporter permease subunit [Thermodesulfobacteriota bacterium]
MFLFVITAVFGSQLPHITKDNSVDKMLPDGDPLLEYTSEIEDVFGSDEFLIVAVESQYPYSFETVAKLVRMTDQFESIPGIIEVVSPTNTKNIMGRAGVLDSEPLIDEGNIPNTPEALKGYRQAIQSKVIFRGSIISGDGQAFGFVLRLEKDPDKAEIFAAVKDVVDQQQGPENIYFSGSPAINIQVGKYMAKDMGRFLPLVIAIILSIFGFRFRSIRGTIFPLLALFLPVIWTLGLMAMLRIPISVIGTMLPTILIAIGSSYSMHILHQYYEDAPGEKERTDFMSEVLEHIGPTIILAGITTAVGFASLMLNDTRILREFGLFSAFGILASMLVSLTFLPACLALFPLPRQKSINRIKGRGLSFLLQKTALFNSHKKYSAIIIGLCLIIVALAAYPRLFIETNAINFFKENDVVRQTIGRVSTQFGGTIPIRTVIDAQEEDAILEPETLRQMEALQRYLENFDRVGKTISIVDMIKNMNMAIHEGDPSYHELPETKRAAQQYLFLYSLASEPDEFKSLINYSNSMATIIARLKQVDEANEPLGTKGTRHILEEVQEYIDREFDPGLKVTPTGRAQNIVRTSDYIVKGLLKSIITATIFIFIISALVFRSAVAGLLSILTVSVALVLNFGVMGWLGIPLDIATTLISSIAIGIGVDDSIHFILRYKRATKEGDTNPDQATITTVNSAGQPILNTSLALILGFSALCVASFKPVIYFGSLTALSMVTTTIGALFILPAVITVIRPRFIFVKPGKK